MVEEADRSPRLAFLAAGIAWQDGLLQAYRNYMVVTQSIFVAADVGLLIAQTGAHGIAAKLIFTAPLVAIATLGIATLVQLGGAIKERAKSVDWWQRRLLVAESEIATNRDFTTFRVAKEHSFRSPELQAHTLSTEDLRTLLRPEQPKARRAFGVFVPGFCFVWALLLSTSLADFIYAR